jgi:hypothetical protein
MPRYLTASRYKDFGQFQSCLSFQVVGVAILIGTFIADLRGNALLFRCFF